MNERESAFVASMKSPLSEEVDSSSVLKKRLYHRSVRRGMKELDVLLGGFADAYLWGLDEEECHLFSILLDVEEPVLLDYFLNGMVSHALTFLAESSLEKKIHRYLLQPKGFTKAS